MMESRHADSLLGSALASRLFWPQVYKGIKRVAAVAVLGIACSMTVRADDRFIGMDAYVEAAMEKWQVPAVSIAVVKDGEVAMVRGYGVREIGKDDAVDGQTVFRLASISKTFTAASVALLIDEGKLDWDDQVKQHLPAFELTDPYMTANTTLRDLLCHRVGLETGDILARRGDLTKDEILSRLKHLQPMYPFRSKYKYSNLMYVVAGEVAGRVSHQPWLDFVQRRVFGPLGMQSTVPTFDRIRTENLAAGYRLHDGRIQLATTVPGIDSVAAAGSVSSNAQDMAQWLKLWLAEGKHSGKQMLAPETVREMLAMHCAIPVTGTNEGNIYAAKFYGWGLGWSVLDYRGRKIHTHGGGSGTFMGFMPQEGIGVVVLANLEFTNLSGMLMYDVFDAYLLGPEEAWSRKNWPLWLNVDEPPEITGNKARERLEKNRKAGVMPSTALSKFAGRYRTDLYGEIEVFSEKGRLSLQLGINPAVPLEHWQGNDFMSPSPDAAPWFDWLLRFQVTSAGEVESIEIDRIGWDEPMPVFHRVRE